MFNKIKPYMGDYIRYTYAALGTMLTALIACMIPFFMVYRIIKPLIDGETLSARYLAIHIAIVFVCAGSEIFTHLGFQYAEKSPYLLAEKAGTSVARYDS